MHSFNIHWRIICEDIRTIDGVIYFILPFLSISLFSFSIPPPFFPFMTLVFPPLPSLTLSSSYFSVTTIVMITLHRWTSSMFFFPWFFSLILFYLSLSTSFCVLCVCVCVSSISIINHYSPVPPSSSNIHHQVLSFSYTFSSYSLTH